MKQDEYSTARPIIKHRVNRSPIVENGEVLEYRSNGICQLHIASEVGLIIETLFCTRYGHALFGSGMFHARQDGIK